MDTPPTAYRFGRFELQTEERRFLADGAPSPITPRAFDVLAVLVQRGGELVTKADLLAIVWPGAFVEEGNLQVQISSLRKALGPRAIETAPGRGYRLTLPITAGFTRSARHNLAKPRTPYVACDELLAACIDGLEHTRLLTLIGRAGIGKSRLAREMGHRCLATFRDGVWLADLALANDASEVARLAAASLPFSDCTKDDPFPIVEQFVRERQVLMILDNCERVADAAATLVHRLLTLCKALKIVATSREPLRVPGESTLIVPPLRVAVPNDEAAKDCESVRLFMVAAWATKPSLALTDADVAVIARICRELDGVPLAIERAAAQVASLSVAAIANTIDRRIPKDEPFDSPVLSDRESALLASAASLPESFTLAAILAGDAECADVLDTFEKLVQRSLVVFDADVDRYRVPATVRRWALALARCSSRGASNR